MEPSVVHLLVGGAVGGAERLVVDLARIHRAQGMAVSLAVVTPSDDLARFVERSGIPQRTLRVRGEHGFAYLTQTYGPSVRRFLTRSVRELGGNLVHAHVFGSHVLSVRVGKALGIPIVRTEHDVAHFEDYSRNTFTRWAMKRTDAVIAISSFVHAYLEAHVREIPPLTRVVKNGVSFERFFPAKLPAPDGPLRFLLVSRLHADKDPELAVRAIASVSGTSLTVLGEGALKEPLMVLARNLAAGDRIHFAGHVTDPERFMAESEVVISTTPRECFGLAAVEAQARGRVVLATRGGGIEDVIAPGASVIVPRNLEDLSAAVRKLKGERDTLEARGAEAARYVATRFPIERTAAGYADVYREVLRLPHLRAALP